MAVAFDTFTSGAIDGGTPNLTHVVTGTNPFLIVGVEGEVSSSANSISGVTYNGVAMTAVAAATNPTSGRWEQAFYLFAPATGSHTITVSTQGSGYIQYIVAASYTGCPGTALDGSTLSTGTGTTSDFANTITTANDNCWHIGYYANVTGRPFLAGTSTTRRGTGGDSNNGWFIGDNNAAITPAGSNTINAKVTSGSGACCFYGVTVSPTTVTVTSIKTFDGLAKASIKTVNGLAIASVKNINGLA